MKTLKSTFSKRSITSDIKERADSAESLAEKPETKPNEPQTTSAFVPQKSGEKIRFYQATSRGSTVIRADGSRERAGAGSAGGQSGARKERIDGGNRRSAGARLNGGRPRRPRDENRNGITNRPKRAYNKYTADGQPKLRIIPAGGVEEIGKNMTIFEYGNDIMVVDMGLAFPDNEMLGIDYVIPDATYLEEHKENIRGVIITHGHLDHIGAFPHIIERIGWPHTYGSDVTIGLIKNRIEEYGIKDGGRLHVVNPDGDTVKFGVFTVHFFRLNHSIPGAMGLEIETPVGRLVYCTDWKFDYTPADGKPASFHHIASLGEKGVKILFSDSTNVEKPGHTISEAVVEEALSGIIAKTKGRLIIAMFSTLINRMQQVINAAHKHGRKVLVVGMSMQKSLEMAIGIKAVTVPPDTLVSERQAKNLPGDKLVVLSTGAQGEDRAALSRMARGDHKIIKIGRGDTVVISASPIPGNERSVSNLMDTIYKAGGSVIYNKQLDIHTSGHAAQEDLKLMIALTKPEHFFPLHGERHKLVLHAKLAQSLGVDPQKCYVAANGQVVEVLPDGKVQITDEHIPNGYVMVDGLGVGDVGNIVIRDRQAMAQNGMLVAITIIDKKTSRVVTSPDIISRGFIYMRENETLVNDARALVRKIVQDAYANKGIDMSEVKEKVRRDLSKLLYQRTEREPMVIAVLKEV